MADEDRKKSFWETLPGIITALAALLTGVAAVIAALNGGEKESAPPPSPQPAQVPVVQAVPVKTPSAAEEVARRAAEEAARAKAEAAAAKAREAELKRKLAEAEQRVAAENAARLAAAEEAAAAKARAEEAERRAAAVEAVRKAAEEKKVTQGAIKVDDFTGMKLVYIPGGCFKMGSPESEEGRDDDEDPVHEVCVDAFWMGKYEVTQGQWEKVMGSNPSYFKKGDDYPVERVSWDDAQGFIKKLNSKSGNTYRLPTEAEWEYACRANSPGKYCGGDDPDAVAWHDGNSGDSTHSVGKKQKNSFDLHDMSGNVWEWCADWYEKGYYAVSPKDNPQGPESDSSRVIRGGGWYDSPGGVRPAYRIGFSPGNRYYDLGFRLILPVQQGR
jgi:formylglycine-generating enzyme required for sulfatase activity